MEVYIQKRGAADADAEVDAVAIAEATWIFYDIFLQNTLLLLRTDNTANVQRHNVYIEHLRYHLPIDN